VAGKVPIGWTRLLDRSHPGPADPHRNLMVAVLRAAIEDICDARVAAPALGYVTSADRRWPFSFENLCEALDLNPGNVRRQLETAIRRDFGYEVPLS
jgi:hypothetical protein